MSTHRVSLRVNGRVQGVFYRQSALQEAQRLGLTGFVRNLPEGDVEAVAEGAPDQTAAFVAWCRRGPPRARVLGVDVSESPATGEFKGFVVTL